MAPLPENNTLRYFVEYQQGAYQHAFTVRCGEGPTPAVIYATIDQFLTAVSPILYALTVTGIRRQNKGSVVSVPVTATIIGNNYGSGTVTPDDAPKMLTFVGRSGTGRRARVSLFGLNNATSSYRLTSAESAQVAAAVDALTNVDEVFVAIDESIPTWYSYADVNYNDHWVKEVRG